MDIRLIATDSDFKDIPLTLNTDYTIVGDIISLIGEPDFEYITVALVPCPEQTVAKFGNVTQENFANAINSMLDHMAFLQHQIDIKHGFSVSGKRPETEDKIAGFVGGCLVPLDPNAVVIPDALLAEPVTCNVTKHTFEISQLFGCWEKNITCWDYGEFCPAEVHTSGLFGSAKYAFERRPDPLTPADVKKLIFKRPRFRRIFKRGDTLCFEFYSRNLQIPVTEIEAYG